MSGRKSFSLVLYPGTKLYEMAKKDGLIYDEKKEIYEKSYTMRAPNYLNLLITLSKGGKMPGPLLKLLVSSPIVYILNSKQLKPFFKYLFIGLNSLYQPIKSVIGKAG